MIVIEKSMKCIRMHVIFDPESERTVSQWIQL